MRCLIAILAIMFALPAAAQDTELPYWASIDAPEANLRVGPGEVFPIEWVYEREGLPVKVIRFHQGWRQIEEPDGTQGWMFSGLLSLRRTAIVVGEELAPMRELGTEDAALRWNVEPGVIGRLGECADGWCEFEVEGRSGWVSENRLWGAGEP